jgi:hypothetical protein
MWQAGRVPFLGSSLALRDSHWGLLSSQLVNYVKRGLNSPMLFNHVAHLTHVPNIQFHNSLKQGRCQNL